MTIAQDRRIWVTMTFHDSAHTWTQDVQVWESPSSKPGEAQLRDHLRFVLREPLVCPFCREAKED